VARHAYPSLDNLSPRLSEEARKRIAPDRGNVWKMIMWSPGMAESFIDFNDAVRYRTSLSDSLRELIILRVGHLCDAPYEIHHHTRISREIGMSEALIATPKVGAGAPGLDATQRLALSLTDDLVKDRRASDDNMVQAIRRERPQRDHHAGRLLRARLHAAADLGGGDRAARGVSGGGGQVV
jgi:alkylhydroperoxidase family enzyme